MNGPFADMTNSEYKKLLTLKIEVPDYVPVKSKVSDDDSVDWRSQMPPVRDQQQCGSCYTFSAIGSVEGRLILAESLDPNTVDLSEQQLVDCSDDYGNNGCNGGSMAMALKYIKEVGGVMNESDYPYVGKDTPCSADESKFAVAIDGVKVSETGNEQALMETVKSGAVSIGIDASNVSFQLYDGGIYDEPKCQSHLLDHGVVLVGYGSEDGTGYWIVRNSWGSSWGEEGYIRVLRDGTNLCGICSSPSYPSNVHSIKK